MRTKNSALNFIAFTGSQLINVVLSFVARTVFIYALSAEYLGVAGLFTNVLTVLSLAELGIGTAMSYYLYKPVSEQNTAQIQQIMNLYKRLYTWVAIVVAALGLILTPFLDVLIKGDTSYIDNLTLIYLLYLFNTVSSYFFSYKRAIIEAHQKAYITTLITAGLMSLQFIIQMIVLVAMHDFVAFLLVQIVCNVATNVIIAIVANRMYPYLKADKKSMPEPEVKKGIFKNISAMFMHRLGDVVVNNTDNILMSAFVGLKSVGIYSNYLMIQSSITTLLNGAMGSFTASIGNLGVEEESHKVYKTYKALNFMSFWAYSFCSVAFLVLYNPFIEAWVGADYTFTMDIVLIFVVNFYIRGSRKMTLTFRDALGLFWYDRYKPAVEVLVNLIVSLLLVVKMGIMGIFIGTLVSNIGICVWVEAYVIYKHGFKEKMSMFVGMYIVQAATLAVCGGLTYYLCSLCTMGGFAEVLIKLLICIFVYNGLILLLYFKTDEFKMIYRQAKSLLVKRG